MSELTREELAAELARKDAAIQEALGHLNEEACDLVLAVAHGKSAMDPPRYVNPAHELEVAETQVDSMLDHIAPQERLDDLNGKLSQVSNWLAGSAPEHHPMRAELEEIINRHSAENGSDTPDFILAEYLTGCLATFDRALKAREEWYGRKLTMEETGAVAGWTPTPEPTETPEDAP